MQDKNNSTQTAWSDKEESLSTLYNRAFEEYGTHALWNMKRFDNPSPGDVRATARQLRIEGDLDARRLAERMEEALLHADI